MRCSYLSLLAMALAASQMTAVPMPFRVPGIIRIAEHGTREAPVNAPDTTSAMAAPGRYSSFSGTLSDSSYEGRPLTNTPAHSSGSGHEGSIHRSDSASSVRSVDSPGSDYFDRMRLRQMGSLHLPSISRSSSEASIADTPLSWYARTPERYNWEEVFARRGGRRHGEQAGSMRSSSFDHLDLSRLRITSPQHSDLRTPSRGRTFSPQTMEALRRVLEEEDLARITRSATFSSSDRSFSGSDHSWHP